MCIKLKTAVLYLIIIYTQNLNFETVMLLVLIVLTNLELHFNLKHNVYQMTCAVHPYFVLNF